MQKQPEYAGEYAPITLEKDFPFAVSQPYVQHDREITSLHSHNYPELGYCWRGNGIFVVGGKVMPFKPGDAVVISTRELHLAQSVPGTESIWNWVYFDPEQILFSAFGNPELADINRFYGPKFNNVLSSDAHPELCRLIKNIVETGNASFRFRRERLAALLGLFAVEMHSAFNAICLPPVADDAPRIELLRRLNASIQYLGQHYNKPLTMEKLCRLSSLSPTHFRRMFRQATGKSPLEYLHRLRIGMAMAELRRNDHSISEIASLCGFETLSSFNRQFKLQMGVCPRDWRKDKKEDETTG